LKRLGGKILFYISVFVLSFYAGLRLFNKKGKAPTILENNVETNMLYFDPITNQKGYIEYKDTKENYTLKLNYSYVLGSIVYDGYLYTKKGSFHIKGQISNKAEAKITNLEKNTSKKLQFGWNLYEMIFYVNKLLSKNDIKVTENQFEGIMNGTIITKEKCFVYNLSNATIHYYKKACLIDQ